MRDVFYRDRSDNALIWGLVVLTVIILLAGVLYAVGTRSEREIELNTYEIPSTETDLDPVVIEPVTPPTPPPVVIETPEPAPVMPDVNTSVDLSVPSETETPDTAPTEPATR